MVETGKRCALVLGGALLLAACSQEARPAAVPPTPPPEPAPALSPAAGTSRTAGPRCVDNFKLFDTNHDGTVSKAEFMAREHWRADPAKIFTARDTNGDGVLTEAEFCSGPRGWRGGPPQR